MDNGFMKRYIDFVEDGSYSFKYGEKPMVKQLLNKELAKSKEELRTLNARLKRTHFNTNSAIQIQADIQQVTDIIKKLESKKRCV